MAHSLSLWNEFSSCIGSAAGKIGRLVRHAQVNYEDLVSTASLILWQMIVDGKVTQQTAKSHVVMNVRSRLIDRCREWCNTGDVVRKKNKTVPGKGIGHGLFDRRGRMKRVDPAYTPATPICDDIEKIAGPGKNLASWIMYGGTKHEFGKEYGKRKLHRELKALRGNSTLLEVLS